VARARLLTSLLLALALAPVAGMANPARDAILAALAAEAKQAAPGFAGFSASRGATLWQADHAGGRPETPSCTTCHTKDPTAEGRTRAGKTIAPMAVSRTPDRFTDAAKVAKWFIRNCSSVLGRTCSPAEKGDIISYLSGQ
jgi:hypothetical protein